MILKPEEYMNFQELDFSLSTHTSFKPFFQTITQNNTQINIMGEDHMSNQNYDCFRTNILSRIENPKDWMFLLEGFYFNKAIMKNVCTLAKGSPNLNSFIMCAYAMDNDVKTDDFVIPAIHPNAIEETIKRSSKEDFELFVVGKLITGVAIHGNGTEREYQEIFENIEICYNIPIDKAKKIFTPDLISCYRHGTHFRQMDKLSADVRNELSSSTLTEIINENQHPNIFINCGAAHLPIIRSVIPEFSIPPEYDNLV